MTNNQDWEQIEFDRIFVEVYENLKEHRKIDKNYSIEDVENFLNSLYISDGNNWDGKGHVSQISNDATIAACEEFLAEWREEIKNNGK